MSKNNIIQFLQILVIALSATSVTAQEIDFDLDWKYSAYGTAIGLAGIADHDIDGDGTSELVFTSTTRGGAHNNLWSVQAYDADMDDYQIVWQSGVYLSRLGRLIIYDIDSATSRVVVGRRDGVVEIWTLNGFTRIDEFTLGSAIEDIVFADSNNDGKEELVFLTSKSIYWVDAATFEILDSEPNKSSAIKIVVGNVDEEPAKEIVLNTGLVLQKTSEPSVEKWNANDLFPSPASFSDQILLHDIDNDGTAEVIAAQRFGEIFAVSVTDRSIIWRFDPNKEINVLSVIDYDQDESPELVFGEGQHGNLLALDLQTRQKLYSVFNPASGFSGLVFARIHPDGKPRFIWGGGSNSSEPDYLHVANTITGIEWSSPAIEGPFKPSNAMNIDLDGYLEYMFTSMGYWHQDSIGVVLHRLGQIGIVNGSQSHVEWLSTSDTWDEFAWADSHDIVVADADRDGIPDIVLGGEVDGIGTIHIIDAATKAIKRTVWLDEQSPIYKLAVADVDGDGNVEIIAAAGKSSTSVYFVYAYSIDGRSGELKWRSSDLFGEKGTYLFENTKDLKIANIDNDPALEIIIAFGDVVVIDGASRKMTRTNVSFDDRYKTAGLAILDINQDSINDVFFATGFGNLHQLDVNTMSAHFVMDLCPDTFLQDLEHLENGWLAYSCLGIDEYHVDGRYKPLDSLKIMNVYTKETAWSTDVNAMSETGNSIRTWKDQNSWYLALGTYQDVSVYKHEGQLPRVGAKGITYIPTKDSDLGDDGDGSGGGGGALTPITIFYLLVLCFSFFPSGTYILRKTQRALKELSLDCRKN